MTVLNDAARAVLTSSQLVHLVTLNADGSPQASVVWAGLDRDQIVVASLADRLKLRNVRRDPRVLLTIEGLKVSDRGLREYLIVHGTGEVTEGGAAPVLQDLAVTYLGPGVKFPPTDDPPAGFLLRITPTRVGGEGPWN